MKTIFRKVMLLLAAGAMSVCMNAQESGEPNGSSLTEVGTFKAAALNVDGMPVSVKIAGVYDLTLNADGKEGPGATAIGQKLLENGYDIIGVSEDFNYHNELMAACNSMYNAGKPRGGIDITLGSYGDLILQNTIFDTDGLNILYKKSRVTIANESWASWDVSYGYTSNGSDRLIDKGFRYYTATIDCNGTPVAIDVYIVHMDAETDPEDNEARDSNVRQVANAILNSHTGRPVLFMGDTNCRYTRDQLKEHFIDALGADPRYSATDAWIEHCWEGTYPELGTSSMMVYDPYYGDQFGEVVDKIIYINNTHSPYQLQALNYYRDTTFVNEAGEELADHKPVAVEFKVYLKQQTGAEEITELSDKRWRGDDPTSLAVGESVNYYVWNPQANKYMAIVNEALTVTDQPQTLWNITRTADNNGKYTVQMKSGNQYFYLNRTGTWLFYSAEPKLSTQSQTIEITTSTSNAQYPAYKLKRTKDTERYLNYDGDKYTAAENPGTQNDWVFISEAQYNAPQYYPLYDEQPTGVTLNPGLSQWPGADVKITIPASGYATYYNATIPYELPAGLTGYIYHNGESEPVFSKAYDPNAIVPQDEALVLGGAPGTYTLHPLATDERDVVIPSKTADNLLHGTATRTLTASLKGEHTFFMALNMNVGEFWQYTGEYFPASRAYLLIDHDSDTDILRIPVRIDETETATDLEAVETDKAVKYIENGQLLIRKNGRVYNAMGQMVK